MTLNEINGSSLPSSVFSHITSFPPFICMQDHPHFTAQYGVAKDKSKFSAFCFHSHDDSFEPVPFTSSELVDNSGLLKKVNNPARNLQVPAKSHNLTRHG